MRRKIPAWHLEDIKKMLIAHEHRRVDPIDRCELPALIRLWRFKGRCEQHQWYDRAFGQRRNGAGASGIQSAAKTLSIQR